MVLFLNGVKDDGSGFLQNMSGHQQVGEGQHCYSLIIMLF